MTTEQLHKEYMGLTKEMAILDTKKKAVASKLMEGMESDELTTTESDLGKVIITERASYKYSEKVDEKTTELKTLKKEEEENEVAVKSTTKYLRATLAKVD